MDFFYGGPFAQSFIHQEMAFTGRGNQHFKELFFGAEVETFGVAQAVTSGFQAPYGFLEGFFVSFANAHNFAYGPHLGTQAVFHAFELFKGPAGELDNHIVAVRDVPVQCPVLSAGDFL